MRLDEAIRLLKKAMLHVDCFTSPYYHKIKAQDIYFWLKELKQLRHEKRNTDENR